MTKLLILIAESNDKKIEFAQNEGFKKLLKLLIDKEENVSQIISKALLHFLSISNSKKFLENYTSELIEDQKSDFEGVNYYKIIKIKIKIVNLRKNKLIK